MRYPRLQKNYGGTVGVTAVGMFGKGSGWGIPTAAHTLDITLGGISEKPVVVDGRLETREYLNMTISMDHDIIDGAPATRFASRLKDLIESGYGLIDQEFGFKAKQFYYRCLMAFNLILYLFCGG